MSEPVLGELVLGAWIKQRDLHPEYRDPTAEFLCRCIGCGRIWIEQRAGVPESPFKCVDCWERARKREFRERVRREQCGHCGQRWNADA